MPQKSTDYTAGVVGSSFYTDDSQIALDVGFHLPDVNYVTVDNQVAGPTTMPVQGLIDDMELTVDFTTLAKDAVVAFSPGTHDYEIRWKEYYYKQEDIESGYALHRVTMRGMAKKAMPGSDIAQGERATYQLSATVLAMYHYVDGEEILAIDKPGKIFRVNGVDVYEDIREGL